MSCVAGAIRRKLFVYRRVFFEVLIGGFTGGVRMRLQESQLTRITTSSAITSSSECCAFHEEHLPKAWHTIFLPRQTLLVPAASRNVPPNAEAPKPAPAPEPAGTPVVAGAEGTAAGAAAAVAAAGAPMAIDVTRPSPLSGKHTAIKWDSNGARGRGRGKRGETGDKKLVRLLCLPSLLDNRGAGGWAAGQRGSGKMGLS